MTISSKNNVHDLNPLSLLSPEETRLLDAPVDSPYPNLEAYLKKNACQYIKQLGYGKNGIVHLIYDIKKIRYIALKQNYHLHISRAEYNLLSDVDHPHIPKAISLDEENRYFCMEYKKGENFLDFIKNLNHQKKTITERCQIALNIGIQLGEIVCYLHREAFLVHRDIRASNIIIREDQSIDLIDFGLSEKLKPKYAPESFRKDLSQLAEVIARIILAQAEFHLGVIKWPSETPNILQSLLNKAYYTRENPCFSIDEFQKELKNITI